MLRFSLINYAQPYQAKDTVDVLFFSCFMCQDVHVPRLCSEQLPDLEREKKWNNYTSPFLFNSMRLILFKDPWLFLLLISRSTHLFLIGEIAKIGHAALKSLLPSCIIQ